VLRVGADVTEIGRLFHTRAAATGKARSPTVERRVGGTTRALVVADRSRRRVSRVETGCNRYLPAIAQRLHHHHINHRHHHLDFWCGVNTGNVKKLSYRRETARQLRIHVYLAG